jgi:colanic acid biosynthesis glycosyl transferase WcaI
VRRRRLLVLNQYYAPAFESTAQLLTQLCEDLAADYDVTVVTGEVEGVPARREVVNGVVVIRVRSTSFERRRLSLRAANYLTYVASTIARVGTHTGADVVLCMSDPPFVSAIARGAARRLGVPYIAIVQDVFPEIAVELGRLKNPLLVWLLDELVVLGLGRADRVVAIGETMRERLTEKGIAADRVAVIRNWVDTQELLPRPKDNEWSRSHELQDSFVVMHSGNVGHAQNLDTLVRAATFLRDLDRLRFVVIGSGARQADLVELSRRLDADGFLFLPYQDRNLLPQSLSAADVHFVGLAAGLSGYVVPSRVNGILSVGRPVIVAADPESEISRIVDETECGLVIPPGRPDLLAGAIRDAYGARYDLEEMGRRGRSYAVANLDRSIAISAYRRVIGELVG